jgi:3-oxoacyl-[acyl-carrier-protein] synthase-3
LVPKFFRACLDFKDRTTCVLFGDGAGAVVLEASPIRRAFWPAICMPMVNMWAFCACRVMSRAVTCWDDPLLKMDGQAVFKLAVGVLEEAARATLAKAGKKRGGH